MFRFLRLQTHQVGNTAALLAFFMLSSSVLAVVRDKIFATYFGAGEQLDTYLAAFKIPDLVFLLVGTLVSSFIIIPFLEKQQQEGKSLQDFIDKLFFTFLILILSVSAIVFFLLPFLAPKVFPGFGADQIENLIWMARAMLLSPIFLSLAAIFASVNQKKSYFVPTALTGVFYNLAIIFGTIVLYPMFGFVGVVSGVVLGAFLYLLLQLPPIFTEKMFIKKIQFFSKKDSWSIFAKAFPRSLALMFNDVLLIFLIAQATLLGVGAVTIFNFAANIYLVPITLVAVAYSVAIFPKLSALYAQGNMSEFKKNIQEILSKILFFAIPLTIFFMVFSKPIVGLLLGSEKFALKEISNTAVVVSVLAPGIIFLSVATMIIRIFYAMGKTWIPLVIVLLELFGLFTAYVLLTKIDFFATGFFENKQQAGLVVVALQNLFATSIFFSCVIFMLKKNLVNFSLFKDSYWIKKILASVFAVAVAWIALQLGPETKNSFWIFFVQICIAGFTWLFALIVAFEFFKDQNYVNLKKQWKGYKIKIWK